MFAPLLLSQCLAFPTQFIHDSAGPTSFVYGHVSELWDYVIGFLRGSKPQHEGSPLIFFDRTAGNSDTISRIHLDWRRRFWLYRMLRRDLVRFVAPGYSVYSFRPIYFRRPTAHLDRASTRESTSLSMHRTCFHRTRVVVNGCTCWAARLPYDILIQNRTAHDRTTRQQHHVPALRSLRAIDSSARIWLLGCARCYFPLPPAIYARTPESHWQLQQSRQWSAAVGRAYLVQDTRIPMSALVCMRIF
ncbi:hypothetical protein C8J57DRAFT_1556867 [Mycena rebaudengoi]|nr:hypothetical protein C8J57DRAFT_1556867 [Mycena rebaudengoi]